MKSKLKPNVKPSKLKEKTLKLLKNRSKELTLKKISSETDITFEWLRDFGQGCIANPGVSYVETLYEYLSNKILKI